MAFILDSSYFFVLLIIVVFLAVRGYFSRFFSSRGSVFGFRILRSLVLRVVEGGCFFFYYKFRRGVGGVLLNSVFVLFLKVLRRKGERSSRGALELVW